MNLNSIDPNTVISLISIATTIITLITLFNKIQTSTEANTKVIEKLEGRIGKLDDSITGIKKDISDLDKRLAITETALGYIKDFIKPQEVLTMEKLKDVFVLKKD